MAVFNLDSVGNLDSANDLKQVKSYLFKLQEQLKYMFANLNPDDNNAAGVPKLTYARDENGEAVIEVTTDGISMKIISGADVDAKIAAAVTIVEDEITAEVSRATGVESSLSSRITVNAGQIALKVNSSDLGNSSLTIKPAAIDLSSAGYIALNYTSQLRINNGALVIDSAGNATFSGNLSAASGTFKGSIDIGGSGNNGSIKVRNSNNQVFFDLDKTGLSFGNNVNFGLNEGQLGSLVYDGNSTSLGAFTIDDTHIQNYSGSVFMRSDGWIKCTDELCTGDLTCNGDMHCFDLIFENQNWDPYEWTLGAWMDWIYDHI